MKTWILDISEENLINILSAEKEVEGRVPDLKKPTKHYHLIKPNDIIFFRVVDKAGQPIKSFQQISFKVIYNHHYVSVREYLESEGLKRALPETKSIDDGIAIYHNFQGYEERVLQLGIYGIGLEKRK